MCFLCILEIKNALLLFIKKNICNFAPRFKTTNFVTNNIRNMVKRHLLLLVSFVCAAALFSSCGSTKSVPYFQDIYSNDSIRLVEPNVITFQPGDKVSIVVNSKDPKLSNLFNLPISSFRVGEANTITSSYNAQVSLYTVDTNGDIDFPVVGKIHIAGKTRGETAELVKAMLVNGDLIKDPVVTVEFGNLYYSVLGEVKNPGHYSIDRDQVTLLDAISKAGDLTIYGERNNVTVLREIDGEQKAFKVNLTSWKEIASSPAYYIKQNDIIYVTPNKTRARQSTVNGNNIRSTSFWISLASLATSIAVLIVK